VRGLAGGPCIGDGGDQPRLVDKECAGAKNLPTVADASVPAVSRGWAVIGSWPQRRLATFEDLTGEDGVGALARCIAVGVQRSI
jgi:hypothetical protein